jgi:ubiquinone/menaquinone biosynthesis C-methylase UbiE
MCGRDRPGRRAILGDWTRLPFAAESFDAVIGDASLNAAPEHGDQIVAEARRVLTKGGKVVERFLPEEDGTGNFVFRTWVFMGERERCTRFVTENRISKAAGVLSHEPMEVPPRLRAERERLGFDSGKFDFVMHQGEPLLLDANRTPGAAASIRELMAKGARNLAEGMHELLTGK